jgi:mono/diheme cytochrome c family protein
VIGRWRKSACRNALCALRPFVLLMGCVAAAGAAEPAADRAVVPGFERFHGSDTLDEAAAGRLLLDELNCVSCHETAGKIGDSKLRKQAPVLDEVGRRVRVDYLRRFIADPQGTKPGTTMPDLFYGIPPAERAARVEALVHFLATTGSIVERLAERKHFENGQKLFHTVGCTACHAPLVGGPLEGSVSVPLPQLSEKYTVDSLETFLEDPLKVRPSGRMPGFPLRDEEIRDLTHYLLRDLAGLTVLGRVDLPKIPYRYYEGDWERLPDFSDLKPQAQGNGAAFDVARTISRLSSTAGSMPGMTASIISS